MIKKITFAIILILSSIGCAFADDFTTFPGSNYSDAYKTINNHKAVKYKKESVSYSTINFTTHAYNTVRTAGVDLSWETCFYRSSHYWKDTFENIKNEDIDLSYLDSHKLNKKITWFEYYGNLIYFVHEDLIEDDDQDEIGRKYLSSQFNIIKEWDYYMIATKKGNMACRTHYTIKDLLGIDKAISWYKVLTFQVGSNPYDKYKFDEEGFNTYYLQLEFIKNWDLQGFIIGLFNLEDLNPYQTHHYGKTFDKDNEMRGKMLDLIWSVESYYEDMWWLPNTINSMYPNWVSYEFIWHNYEVKYETIDDECFKVYFKPKSYDFRKVYGFEMNGEWRWYTYCVK